MVDWLWGNGRTFRLVPRLGLLRQPQPRQRDIEHDGFVFGRLLALSLANAIRGVLTIPCYADHHRPHHACTRPETQAYRAGNCDQLQTKMRREPKLPPQHSVMVGELANFTRQLQLAWRTSGFCRRSRSRSSSRASVELHTCSATQYGQKMRPPVTAGELWLSKPVKT